MKALQHCFSNKISKLHKPETLNVRLMWLENPASNTSVLRNFSRPTPLRWVEQIYLMMGLLSNVKAVERYTFDERYMSDQVGRPLSWPDTVATR